ncbi:MAG: hypothetical protein ACK5NF_01395 [Bacilli bacterium]
MKLNLEVIEMMLFFWHSTKDKEKVSDIYLNDIANREEMKIVYNDEFDAESVRKVLSAITNREVLSSRTKTEGLFWNNNMWMTEDLGVTQAMIDPIKALNLDEFDFDGEVIFVPGHSDVYYLDGNKLYINFFKVMVDVFGGTMDVTIEGMNPKEFIASKLSMI